jgi:hypothetical protein
MGISECAAHVFRVYAVQVQLGKDTKGTSHIASLQQLLLPT